MSPATNPTRNQYFGCTTGRVANRIAKGSFTLDGKEYKLAINNGPNHLHGGVKRSLDKVVWKGTAVKGGKGDAGVRFEYTSPDGEEGYPGNLKIAVTYTLTKNDTLQASITPRPPTRRPRSISRTTAISTSPAPAPGPSSTTS